MPQRPVSIIIPVYNKWPLTAACLRSLRDHAPERPFEVIVADNASADATAMELPALGRELFGGNFTHIRNAENKNFSGACNQGARAARHDFLFFLNNDTLLTPAWDAPLFAAMENDAALGAAGPLLLFENNTVQHLGITVQPDRSLRHLYGRIPGTHPLARKHRPLSFITAAALLIRKSTFFEAGAFYEGYVNGLEDVELCYRLRKAGYAVRVVAESVIYHLDGQTRREITGAPKNAPILSQRCPDLRKPEYHHTALADGYTPFLGPFFETLLQPAPERLRTYTPLLAAPEAGALSAILDRELYWLDGYVALARLQEATGETENAFATMERCAHFYPTMSVMEMLPDLAEKTGRHEAAREYGATLAGAREKFKDSQFFQSRLDATLNIAAALEDRELERLAKAWRKQYGRQLLSRPD